MKRFLIVSLFLCFALFVWSDAITDWQWEWAISGGSNWIDYGYSVAVDEEGYSYVTGSFEWTATFNTVPPTHLSTPSGLNGDSDIFVAKVSPSGEWIWAVRAGGLYSDTGRAIAVDNMGNVFVTGSYMGTANFGPHSVTSVGVGMDIFVAKLDGDNGNWIWVQSAGGFYEDWGRSIAVDSSGNAYITGFFWFSASFDGFVINSDQDEDIFVAKINTNGVWQWVVKAGGSYVDEGLSLVIDDGYGYVTGFFADNASFGIHDLTTTGQYDEEIFVAKFNCTNGNWLWATQAGGNFYDKGYSVALDIEGNPYVTGSFQDFADFGTHTLVSDGSNDIFVAKLNQTGTWLWATSAGGSGDNKGHGIVVDKYGFSFIIGSYQGEVEFGSFATLNCWAEYDAFVAGLNDYGEWVFVTDIKGYFNVQGMSIAVDYTDCNPTYYERNIIVAGFFKEQIFFTDSDFVLTSPGCSEIFVAKLSLGSDITLPIELASFAAHQTVDKFVDLTWVSETESNMLGYRIYRSEINSLSFAYQITTFPIPANNSSQTQVYNYIDEEVYTGHTYFYWLQAVDLDLTHSFHGPVSVSVEEDIDIPVPVYTTLLKQNQPNPFVTETKISYSLSREDSENVELKIYNVKGQLVRTLHRDQQAAGEYVVEWDGRDDNERIVPSGVYFYRLKTPNYDRINKMMLVK